jgi:hypothetical protein
VITEEDIKSIVAAGRGLPPAVSSYLEEDFVMNLLETVLDYMLQTTVVVTALEYFRTNRWNDVRTLDDLEGVLARYPEDQTGNTALAIHLWCYRLWTRGQQLRNLVRYFRSIGVVDRESLKAWAHARGRTNAIADTVSCHRRQRPLARLPPSSAAEAVSHRLATGAVVAHERGVPNGTLDSWETVRITARVCGVRGFCERKGVS